MSIEQRLPIEDEYEEIDVAEVDRVLVALDQIIESTDSETIRSYLETTAEEISYLVDDEEDLDEISEAA